MEEFKEVKEILESLNLKKSAKIIDITNGKELSVDEFTEYLEKELNPSECCKDTPKIGEIVGLAYNIHLLKEVLEDLTKYESSMELSLAKMKIEDAINWLVVENKNNKKD